MAKRHRLSNADKIRAAIDQRRLIRGRAVARQLPAMIPAEVAATLDALRSAGVAR